MDGQRSQLWSRSRAKTSRGVILSTAVAVALRIALFVIPSVSLTLQRRPELAPPLTSFRSLKEGVYIYEKGSNPYAGGIFYHSPLYLALFSYIIPASSDLLTSALWILADLVGSQALVRIYRERHRSSGGVTDGEEAMVSALFLLNPYTLLSCVAKTTTTLDNTAVLLALSFAAASEQSVLALLSLAFAVHFSLYPILLLPPIIMLLLQRERTQCTQRVLTKSTISTGGQGGQVFKHLTTFMAAFAGLAAFNCSLVGLVWVDRTWGVIVNVTDLTPNVGMWWYFFTEMFDHFRTFFLGVFQLHLVIYVIPLCLRLWDDPLFAALVLVGVFSTWKSYPALGDMALFAGLLGCFPQVGANLRHPLFTLTVHLYTSILLPLLHSLWLLTGTGNANFFYAATMVYGLNACLAVVDVLGAGLRLRVKQQVGEGLLVDETGIDEKEVKQGTSTPWEKAKTVNAIWEKKGWAVVQFTSASTSISAAQTT